MRFADNSPAHHSTKMRVARAIISALLCISVCISAPAAHSQSQSQNAAIDAPKHDTHGISVANMDPSVKPGEDFYEYANGAWIKRTEIPPDRGRVGGFNTRRSEKQADRRVD